MVTAITIAALPAWQVFGPSAGTVVAQTLNTAEPLANTAPVAGTGWTAVLPTAAGAGGVALLAGTVTAIVKPGYEAVPSGRMMGRPHRAGGASLVALGRVLPGEHLGYDKHDPAG